MQNPVDNGLSQDQARELDRIADRFLRSLA